jgi:hypothetical protein
MRVDRQLSLVVLIAGSFASVQTAKAQSSGKTVIPPFTTAIVGVPTAESFQAFVDKNRGKLVRFNLNMAPPFSRIGDKIKGKEDLWSDLFVATSPCAAPQNVLVCAGAHYLLSGKDFVLEYYEGNNRLNGYFVISENTENHQGIYYLLKSVPAAQVLLQTQRGKE